MRFEINAKLPSLNDYINACRHNRYAGAKFKKDIESLIGFYITQAVKNGEIKPIQGSFILEFVWHEKYKRRDPDNVATAKKYILDALQVYGIIKNDSPKYVKGFTDSFVYGAPSDKVIITIWEVVA